MLSFPPSAIARSTREHRGFTGASVGLGRAATDQHSTAASGRGLGRERVTDHLWRDERALRACTLVCRRWYPRSRRHLLGIVRLDQRRQVVQLANIIRGSPSNAESLCEVVIRGASNRASRKPIPHLGTFAMMFANRLTRLEVLYIWNADSDWTSSLMDPDVLLHLSAFSFTCLVLDNVKLPSMRLFARLISFLPELDHLICRYVAFSSSDFDAGFVRKFPPRGKLTRLELDGSCIPEIINVLLVAGSVVLCRVELGCVKYLQRQDLVLALPDIQRLLDASCGSLQRLEIGIAPESHSEAAVELPAGNMLASVGTEPGTDELLRGIYLDYTRNVELRELTLKTQLRKEVNYALIRDLLFGNGMLPQSLHKIVIYFDVDEHDPFASQPFEVVPGSDKKTVIVALRDRFVRPKKLRDEPMLHLTVAEKLTGTFNSQQYDTIDDTLSTSQWSSVKEVLFCCWVRNRDIPDERRWLECLSGKLPKLHARGILRTRVSVS